MWTLIAPRNNRDMLRTDASLETLFDDWELAIGGEFQRDGIVDREKYGVAPRWILFVTKEANNILKDQRVQAREASLELLTRGIHGWAYWRTLARWSYALLNNFADLDIVEQNYARSGALLSVAIMNLKKIPGGSKALPKRIEEFATINAGWIIREIELINPQVIVCGGVGQTLRTVLCPAAETRVTCYGISYFYWGHVPVFDYRHPQYISAASELDPPLVKSAKQLLHGGESLKHTGRTTQEEGDRHHISDLPTS
jgi:hypothetical protein